MVEVFQLPQHLQDERAEIDAEALHVHRVYQRHEGIVRRELQQELGRGHRQVLRRERQEPFIQEAGREASHRNEESRSGDRDPDACLVHARPRCVLLFEARQSEHVGQQRFRPQVREREKRVRDEGSRLPGRGHVPHEASSGYQQATVEGCQRREDRNSERHEARARLRAQCAHVHLRNMEGARVRLQDRRRKMVVFP